VLFKISSNDVIRIMGDKKQVREVSGTRNVVKQVIMRESECSDLRNAYINSYFRVEALQFELSPVSFPRINMQILASFETVECEIADCHTSTAHACERTEFQAEGWTTRVEQS
jgi:hypothetical protein